MGKRKQYVVRVYQDMIVREWEASSPEEAKKAAWDDFCSDYYRETKDAGVESVIEEEVEG